MECEWPIDTRALSSLLDEIDFRIEPQFNRSCPEAEELLKDKNALRRARNYKIFIDNNTTVVRIEK